MAAVLQQWEVNYNFKQGSYGQNIVGFDETTFKFILGKSFTKLRNKMQNYTIQAKVINGDNGNILEATQRFINKIH